MNDLQQQVLEWFASGSVGSSSKCMAKYLALGTITDRSHPYDPDDLDRCLQLLEAAPGLRQRLHKMADVSPQWAALVSRWDELEACHLEEVGLRWSKASSAPKTFRLMQEIFSGAIKGDGQ